MSVSRAQPAAPGKRLRLGAWLVLGVLLLLSLVPPFMALGDLGLGFQRLPMLVESLVLLAALACLPALLPSRGTVIVVSLVFLGMLFVRLVYYGLVQFSGTGFSNELFIHLGGRSIVLAWQQYRVLFLLLLAAMAALPLALWPLSCKCRHLPLRFVLPFLALAAAGLAMSHRALPEWMLLEAGWNWYGPKRFGVSSAELAQWRSSGLVDLDLLPKELLQVEAATPPRNLILIYLESVGQAVVAHPAYPRLMPHLAQRMARHNLLPDFHAASFITIEGIVNSQCGTLFPFERNNDALAGFDRLAEHQACLGDVLARAGYAQTYLGGAESTFAGKGHFLAAHGYDRVLGFEHWQEQGLAPRPGGWGLGDPDLFDQAFAELERLRAGGKPFNLTLLTIGTHLPGFTYPECAAYGGGPFIEALHCTDQLLERWLQRVEAAGFLEDTVVVITADHHVFPGRRMKELFGEAAVLDRRLPFIVMGASAMTPHAAVDEGANYDLAPTVLDLLGVRHDARFALGRSLLRPESARDYFPTRYADIRQGEEVEAVEGPCRSDLLTPPLGRCEKDVLLTLLRRQNRHFSLPATQLDCRDGESARVLVPADPGAAVQISIGGVEQAERFAWQSRAGREREPGLFVAVFREDGRLLKRSFVPLVASEALASPPELAPGRAAFLVWRGSEDGPQAPAWLPSSAAAATAAILAGDGRLEPLPARTTEHGDLEFVLAPAQCPLPGP